MASIRKTCSPMPGGCLVAVVTTLHCIVTARVTDKPHQQLDMDTSHTHTRVSLVCTCVDVVVVSDVNILS